MSHRRAHTTERPHHCTVCSKTFVEKGNLLRHMKKHNGAVLPTTTMQQVVINQPQVTSSVNLNIVQPNVSTHQSQAPQNLQSNNSGQYQYLKK